MSSHVLRSKTWDSEDMEVGEVDKGRQCLDVGWSRLASRERNLVSYEDVKRLALERASLETTAPTGDRLRQ